MCKQLTLHGSKLPEPRFAGLMDFPGLSSDALNAGCRCGQMLKSVRP
jgi:hypothetical protein